MVSGKLVPPPKLKIQENDSISMQFVPDGGDKQATGYFADVNPKDLSFSLKLPVDKYKIAVSISGYPGEKTTLARTEKLDELNGAFSWERTPIVYEVTSEPNQTITVDMAQGRAAKN